MTGSTPYANLDRWLDQATRGVPRRRVDSIRAELTAHFEDTTADLLEQGIPPATAQQRALAALGDPQAVARGFNGVHHSPHHYLVAALACLLLLLENFDLPQRFLMPDGTGGSIFYAADHALTTLLTFYVVLVMGRLVVGHHAAKKIVLGGLLANLVGAAILDLVGDTWATVPTLLKASNGAEGLGFLLRDGGILASSAGLVVLGVGVLPALNPRAKGLAIAVIIEGMAPLLYLITLYLDGRNFLYFFLLLALNTMILLPAISLVFMRAWISSRHLPAQLA